MQVNDMTEIFNERLAIFNERTFRSKEVTEVLNVRTINSKRIEIMSPCLNSQAKKEDAPHRVVV